MILGGGTDRGVHPIFASSLLGVFWGYFLGSFLGVNFDHFFGGRPMWCRPLLFWGGGGTTIILGGVGEPQGYNPRKSSYVGVGRVTFIPAGGIFGGSKKGGCQSGGCPKWGFIPAGGIFRGVKRGVPKGGVPQNGGSYRPLAYLGG